MVRKAELADGTILEFPDETSDTVMQASVKKYLASKDDRSIGGFLNNILSSGGKMVSDVASSVMNPKQTVMGLHDLGAGAIESLIPGEQGHERNFDALIDMYKQRYGGLENIEKTAYEDPVGVLADLSTLIGGAGMVAKGVGIASKAGKLGNAARIAENVSKIAGTASAYTDPLNLAIAKPAGTIIKATKTPERIYRSALKPSLENRKIKKIPETVKSGIKEGIPVSEGGYNKTLDLIDELNNKISREIQAASASGVDVSSQSVASRIDDLLNEYASALAPQKDLDAIAEVKQRLLSAYPYGSIPIDEAQKIKQGAYQRARLAFGELSSPAKEAEKALGRGLKEEIATAVPVIDPLNVREGALIGLQDEIKRAVNRRLNAEPIPMSTPVVGSGIGVATGSAPAGIAAAVAKQLLSGSNAKSRLAIGMDRFARSPRPFTIAPTALSREREYQDFLDEILGQYTPEDWEDQTNANQ